MTSVMACSLLSRTNFRRGTKSSRMDTLQSQQQIDNSKKSFNTNLPSSLRGANKEKTLTSSISKGTPNDWVPPKYCGNGSNRQPNSLKPPKKLIPKGVNRFPKSTEQASKKKVKAESSGPFCSIFRAIVALSLCVCIGGVAFLAITLGSSDRTYPQPESPQRQFVFSLQVQEIDNEAAEWTSDLNELNSPKAQNIIRALRPRIRSAFESEGLKTNDIYVTEMGPVSVTVYSVFNNTITSLTSGEEISMVSSYEKESGISIAEENKPRRQGTDKIIRIKIETSGLPSQYAKVISQVGETENEKIERMLDKYLGNQGVIAKAESFSVSPEFRRTAKSITNSKSDVESSASAYADMAIDCYRSGETLGVTRATVICPPKCKDVRNALVVGTDRYYISSMICLAAIHNGLIQNAKGGRIEYIQSGNGFLFSGSSRNGVTSTSLFKYGRKFYVKKPGPSWTTTASPITNPLFTGLQGSRGTLMTGKATGLSIDGAPLTYTLSLSYSSKLKNQMTALLENKIFYSLEDMAFRVEKTKVSEFEPDAANSALRFTFEIQGHFGKNAKALSPYMPLDNDRTSALTSTLADNLLKEGLGTTGLTIQVSEKFVTSWSDGDSGDTISNEESTNLVCACVDVFFVVDTSAFKSESNARNVLRMYKEILQYGNFDQVIDYHSDLIGNNVTLYYTYKLLNITSGKVHMPRFDSLFWLLQPAKARHFR